MSRLSELSPELFYLPADVLLLVILVAIANVKVPNCKYISQGLLLLMNYFSQLANGVLKYH